MLHSQHWELVYCTEQHNVKYGTLTLGRQLLIYWQF